MDSQKNQNEMLLALQNEMQLVQYEIEALQLRKRLMIKRYFEYCQRENIPDSDSSFSLKILNK